jgi:hypothetical protein
MAFKRKLLKWCRTSSAANDNTCLSHNS